MVAVTQPRRQYSARKCIHWRRHSQTPHAAVEPVDTVSAPIDPPGPDRLPADALLKLIPMLRKVDGELELPHTGTSMHPAIPDGATIRLRCDRLDLLAPGDIVTWQSGSGVVTHRVFHCRRRARTIDYILTRGDARRIPDSPIPMDALLGVVTTIRVEGDWIAPGSIPSRDSMAIKILCLILGSALETHAGLARTIARGLDAIRNLRMRVLMRGRAARTEE